MCENQKIASQLTAEPKFFLQWYSRCSYSPFFTLVKLMWQRRETKNGRHIRDSLGVPSSRKMAGYSERAHDSRGSPIGESSKKWKTHGVLSVEFSCSLTLEGQETQ